MPTLQLVERDAQLITEAVTQKIARRLVQRYRFLKTRKDENI